MGHVNKVILVGNLGADPELRQTGGGQSVCSMRLATTEVWNDRDGTRQERTEWHRITVWGKQAESCARFLAKGRQVYVEGRLQSSTYTDKEGVERRGWDVVTSNVVFLGSREGGGGGQRQQQSGWGGQQQSSGGGWGHGSPNEQRPNRDQSPIPF